MNVLDIVDVPLWLIAFIAVLAAIYLYIRSTQGLWKRLGVPGPDPTPILGILGTLRKNGRIQTAKDLVKKYGKIIGTYHGFQPCLMLADPELVKRIMVKEFSSFPNRYNMFEPLREFKLSVLFAEGEHWKFVRSTLTPTFTSGKMRYMNPLIQKCYMQLLDNIKRQSEGGNAVEMKGIFGSYTMDVIATTAFGMEVDSQKDPNNKFVKTAKAFFENPVISKLALLMILFPKVGQFLTKFSLRPRKTLERIRFLKTAVLSVIEMRKNDGYVRQDFLDLMMNAHKDDAVNGTSNGVESDKQRKGLSLDEVIANSIIFMIAGYDTTANTLSFMSYHLAVEPECQEKLIKEIDDEIGMAKLSPGPYCPMCKTEIETIEHILREYDKDLPDYENIQKLKYLEMVMSETLRLHGPVIRINRRTECETDIDGYKIPANTELDFSIYMIHRDPKNWPDPEKFDPERFTPENKEKRHPYSFMPFGHGPRKCIGMRLAQMEAKAAIVYILQRYRFVKCQETEVPIEVDKDGPLLRAKNGIHVKVMPRN